MKKIRTTIYISDNVRDAMKESAWKRRMSLGEYITQCHRICEEQQQVDTNNAQCPKETMQKS